MFQAVVAESSLNTTKTGLCHSSVEAGRQCSLSIQQLGSTEDHSIAPTSIKGVVAAAGKACGVKRMGTGVLVPTITPGRCISHD